MRILAIETTERVGSLAVFHGNQRLAETDLPADQRTAAAIGPSVSALLAQVDWRPTDVQLLAVTTGPGSFTGLRIAVTFAKSFAYAVGAEVIGCDTLDVIAAAVPAAPATLWIATDAQRQQTFARRYALAAEGHWTPQQATRIIDNDEWLECLDADTLVAGGALERLASRLPAEVRVADKDTWRPRAACLGEIAWRDYQQGRRDDLWQLVPIYYRLSYAEEMAAQRQSD